MNVSIFKQGYTRIVLIALLAIAALYCILLFSYHGPLNAFYSSDHGVKLIQTQSLIITKFGSQALVYPGETIDPQQRFIPFRGQYLQHNGHSYAMFSQLFAAVSAIPLFFFGYAGLYLVPLASALGILALAALLGNMLLRPFTNSVSLIALGIASPLIFYAINFWEHSPATLLSLAAVYCSVLARKRNRFVLSLLAGLLLALATAFRNEAILFAPAMLISLMMLDRRQALGSMFGFGAGLTLGILPLLLFNASVYGNIQGPHVAVAGAAQRLSLTAWVDLLLLPLKSVSLVICCVALVLVYAINRTPIRLGSHKTWLSIVLISLVTLQSTAPLEETSLTSLLTSFPWVLLIFLVLPEAEEGQQAAVSAYIRNIALLFLFFCLLLRLPDGGAQHGPRMFLPAMPLLLIAGMWRAERFFDQQRDLRQKAALLMMVTLIAQAALSAQASGLRDYRYIVVRNHTILSTAAQSGYEVIITDTDYAPLLIAPLMYDGHRIFMIRSGQELDDLIERLHASQIDQFYYLGQMSSDITQQSAYWKNLQPLNERSSFAHRLLGQAFRITH